MAISTCDPLFKKLFCFKSWLFGFDGPALCNMLCS